MGPDQVMTVLERYFEGPRMGNTIQGAGSGRSDSHTTGGLKGGQLFRCEVGAALSRLSRDQALGLARYFHAWCDIQVRRAGEGALLDPRDDHNLRRLGREPHTRHALIIMGRELHMRLRG